MKLRHIISSALITITIILFTTLPVLAEQASAESADFTVNTVPEPSALILLVMAGFLFRRMRGAKTLCIALFALCITMPALQTYATAPIVSNITAQQQAWPLMDVDIYYDLYDADGDSNYVYIAVSTNSGALYNLVASNFTGDVGNEIAPGEGKHIVWDAAMDIPQYSSSTVRVKITVDNDMVLIPAGSFDMGDTFNEGNSDELPVHSVYISAFYMDKYEITKSKSDEVFNWSFTNGYFFYLGGSGKETNHPVQNIDWFDMVKWCNARSEKEGRTPCYYTSSSKTTVYKSGEIPLANDWVNWEANGYRLPTEAEWEKAARGGAAGHRFPWTDADTISHIRANFKSHWQSGVPYFTYDVSTTAGYHPTYDDGTFPYTSPVGSFAANGYGLYDMAGNVREWCWDWYDANYYSNSPPSNPHGPAPNTQRVTRGGDWFSVPSYPRCADRIGILPIGAGGNYGFRCVRKAD